MNCGALQPGASAQAANDRRRQAIVALLVLATAVGAAFAPVNDLAPAARIALAIFVMAAGLWITELIPPFATSILVIVLSVVLLGRPDLGSANELRHGFGDYQAYLNPLANPVLVLFFASFLLAIAANKYGLDVVLAGTLLRPFGVRPAGLLLGVIAITGLLSMCMSYAATAAMMVGVLMPLLRQCEGRPRLRSALTLSVPFAASIGSMGTIVGAPPNAVAASILAERGAAISFVHWSLIAAPFVAVMLLVLWGCTCFHAGRSSAPITVALPAGNDATGGLWLVVATFAATMTLWITEPLHGISSSIVALAPIAVLTASGVIGRDELRKVPWDVLILVAGGLALSIAAERSGLAKALIDAVSFESLPPVLGMLLIGLLALVLCNLMSNTATTALLVSITISTGALHARSTALAVAFAASLALSLPVSQPASAVAFSTGWVSARLMLKYGTFIALIGIHLAIVELWLIRWLFPDF